MNEASLNLLMSLIDSEISYTEQELKRSKLVLDEGKEDVLASITCKLSNNWLDKLRELKKDVQDCFKLVSPEEDEVDVSNELSKIIEHAKQYHLDRIKELRNQLPFGDPFVFIGAIVVLGSANFYTNPSFYRTRETGFGTAQNNALRLLAEHKYTSVVGRELSVHLVTLCNMTTVLSSKQSNSEFGVRLTHEKGKHLTVVGNKRKEFILEAEQFLNDVEEMVIKMFDDNNTKINRLHIVGQLESHPLFGTTPVE